MTSGGSKVVEHSAQLPIVEGSSLTIAGTIGQNVEKIVLL
jgi:hypothetical protein